MKQITQKELIKLIEEKQENAKNSLEQAWQQAKANCEKGKRERFAPIERNKAYIDAYQDLICYINSVEIVPERIEANKGQFVGGNYPEEKIVTTIPKEKQEELGLTEDDLKEMIEKTPITPYNEPKVEPLRHDRMREFFFDNGARRIIDAKAVKTISLEESYTEEGYNVYVDKFIMKKGKPYDECKKCYDDLVEWWKYWKQN